MHRGTYETWAERKLEKVAASGKSWNREYDCFSMLVDYSSSEGDLAKNDYV